MLKKEATKIVKFMLKKITCQENIYSFFYEKGEYVDRASALKQVVRTCKCITCLALYF